jgi:hypothetical protein
LRYYFLPSNENWQLLEHSFTEFKLWFLVFTLKFPHQCDTKIIFYQKRKLKITSVFASTIYFPNFIQKKKKQYTQFYFDFNLQTLLVNKKFKNSPQKIKPTLVSSTIYLISSIKKKKKKRVKILYTHTKRLVAREKRTLDKIWLLYWVQNTPHIFFNSTRSAMRLENPEATKAWAQN